MAKRTAKTRQSAKAKAADSSGKYRSFRLSKRIRHPYADDMPKFRSLLLESWRLWRNYRKPFGLFLLTHFILIMIFVPVRANFDIGELKESVSGLFGGEGSQLVTLSIVVGALVGSLGSAVDQASALYTTLITFIMSLAYIWALRHMWARKKVTIRDAFYNGMYPLIPFILVLAVLSLQLLPMGMGVSLFASLRAAGLIVTVAEWAVILLLLFTLILLAGYFLTSTTLALYAVSLPEIKPVQAMRAARKLVEFRRWQIFRRILQILLFMVLVGLVVLVVAILVLPGLVFWLMTALSILALPVLHTYLYTLYRKLL